uniref:Uncharacterized protein n=1 Tax=Oryza rufipogon TaxID=4529 RepID=A0A0E0N0J9_ORYRU
MASLRALPLLVLGMALCALALFPFVASASRDLRHHPAGFVLETQPKLLDSNFTTNMSSSPTWEEMAKEGWPVDFAATNWQEG